jgi:hypothetical protein
MQWGVEDVERYESQSRLRLEKLQEDRGERQCLPVSLFVLFFFSVDRF